MKSAPKQSPKKRSSANTREDTIDTLKRAVAYNLLYSQGIMPVTATLNDYYMAVARTVRDRMTAPLSLMRTARHAVLFLKISKQLQPLTTQARKLQMLRDRLKHLQKNKASPTGDSVRRKGLRSVDTRQIFH